MNRNYEIFAFHLAKLESILSIAQLDADPARILYQKDGRTPLFMLEGLARLYGNIHNKNKFEKLKTQFKLLEDALGAIDYYDVYVKSYQNIPSVPEPILRYMEEKRDSMFENLNQILRRQGWIGEKSNRLKKIRNSLKEMKWLSPKREIVEIKKLYLKTIESIQKFIKKNANPFREMELQVHELRRDLRWLSIYPHALQGKIQFGKEKDSEIITSPFLSEEIKSSKYNQFPEQGKETWVLLLEKNYFYALSWVIAELGKQKDEGLEYFALMEAWKDAGLTEEEAISKTLEFLNWKPSKFPSLLDGATGIANRILQSGILDKLVYGIAHTKKHKN